MKTFLPTVLAAGLLCGVTLHAGSFTSDFSNPNQTGFSLTSNNALRPDGVTTFTPEITDGHLVLTWNENSEQGTIVLDDLDAGAPIEGFTATFKLQIGPGSGNPADGTSFSFGPGIDSFSNFGEEGTGTGVTVTFDIYDNGGGEAPAIDVKYGDTQTTVATSKFTKADLVTGVFEDVQIQVTRSGTISVTYKGQRVHDNLIIPDFAPLAGQFAIGARTGGENANQWLDDLSITTTPAGATVAPTVTVPPQSQTINEGSPVTFAIGFDGSAPLSFQWLSNNVPIVGATSPSYSIDRVPASANGASFKCTVSNSANSVTSPEAILTVNSDLTPPVLGYATGSSTFAKAKVWFSESVDPVTAQTASNYQLSGGATVSSATLAAPAGTPGDNVVDLVTSVQTPGQAYTLTVNNVKDTAGNTIVAGSTVQFSAWVLSQGFLLFEHFDNLGGAADTDIDTALADPRVVAGTPTTAGFLSGQFNTRTFFADDSHENYLGRMTGWITPAESGDYYFFLRADDAARLYLSTTETPPDPAVDLPIANEPDCCDGFYEPDSGDPATTATAIPLVAGQRYAVLALLKEATGGDYLMVAWRKSTDTTPAASLPNLPGQYLSTYVDPNVELAFVTQPTDQLGVLPSTGIEIFTRDFNANDGGFTVVNSGDLPAGWGEPWAYTSGLWSADGSSADCGGPFNTQLSSPTITLSQDGAVSLTFSHRYSFESGLYDAGLVRISVNGGPFASVPADNFSANGYAAGAIVGNGIALGQRGFNGSSAGYAGGEFITSKAFLGTFSRNDTLVVQFVGAWDECSNNGSFPGWQIDSLKLELLPMIIQNFIASNGGFTVENTTPPPAGPWVYDATAGQWVADGSGDSGGPYNTKLNSPAYVVPQSDEVTLNFTHRYSFEGDYWDGGQVRISVNGGAFTPVPAESFTANGYAAGVIQGTGILNGQRAFNGDSPGYATTNLITSSAVLGTFSQNDTIVVQFVGAYDESASGSHPSWVIRSVQLAFGKAAKASTFVAEVAASRQGLPEPITYQWQRNDGAGWVDIAGANSPSFRIFPTAADFQATFRLVATVPGKSIISNVVKLVTELVETPTISVGTNPQGQPVLTFTGALIEADAVTGPYNPVAGATSPFTVTGGAGAMKFYRSSQ